jgi:polyhydroxyalkanoate synthase subunit PhaC
MYQDNLLVKPGGITLQDVPLDLGKIATPTFILSTKEDHIAPWRSTYAATQIYRGPKKFVLSASGHIAGVVNPPASKKYNYWTNADLPTDPDEWLAAATQQAGSWWPEWQRWVAEFSGGEVKARKPGDGKLKPLEPAPGSYVTVTLH